MCPPEAIFGDMWIPGQRCIVHASHHPTGKKLLPCCFKAFTCVCAYYLLAVKWQVVVALVSEATIIYLAVRGNGRVQHLKSLTLLWVNCQIIALTK